MKVDQWNEVAPFVVEKSTANTLTLATVVANGVTLGPLILNVSTIAAREVDILIVSDQAITLTLRKCAIGKQISTDAPIPVAANTPTTAQLIQDATGFGQVLDLLVTNASGGVANVACWVAAKT